MVDAEEGDEAALVTGSQDGEADDQEGQAQLTRGFTVNGKKVLNLR